MGHGNAAAAVLVFERACHFLNRLAMEKSHMGHVLKHQTIRYFLDTFVVFIWILHVCSWEAFLAGASLILFA